LTRVAAPQREAVVAVPEDLPEDLPAGVTAHLLGVARPVEVLPVRAAHREAVFLAMAVRRSLVAVLTPAVARPG